MSRFFTVGKYRVHNRKDHRYELPRLTLMIGSHQFNTYDWSMGGFRIEDYMGRPPVGDTIAVTELSYSPESTVKVDARATVTRIVLGKNQIALAFNQLDEAAFNFLEEASLQRLALLSNSAK